MGGRCKSVFYKIYNPKYNKNNQIKIIANMSIEKSSFQTIKKSSEILVLVGPGGAGKGTQANLSKQKSPELNHVDYGASLRLHIENNIGNINQEIEVINPTATANDIRVARSLKADMTQSNPVKNEDLIYVVQPAIISSIKKGQSLIVDGAGRTVEDAQWLSALAAENNVGMKIANINIPLEKALERAENRFLVYGIKTPFASYESAKAMCSEGQEPYKRGEDLDPELIAKRYVEMYSRYFASIISIFQLVAKAELFTVDGTQSVEQVSSDITQHLKRLRGYNL
jgi:adenylate kinase family enzyme